MNRRSIISIAGGVTLVSAFSSFAQQQSKMFKIGWLWSGSAESSKLLVDTIEQEFRKLGYVEGKNVSFDRRFVDGITDRLPALAVDLVRQDPNVLFAAQGAAVAALKKATSSIPIVFSNVSDPLGFGLVASLARPGGNVTGVSSLASNLLAKRLQLVKEAFSERLRVAAFFGPDGFKGLADEVQRGAKLLGMDLLLIEPQQSDDIERSATQLHEWRAGAIFVVDSGFHFRYRKLLIDLAAKTRLPATYPNVSYVEDGGLMCYGADFLPQLRLAAGYIHKILNGAKPADLPVEQSAAFDLAINLKTAKALGIKFPQSVLVQATKVIE